MHPEIALALSKLGSEVKDRATCENAVIILALAMEKSNATINTPSNWNLYRDELPSSLLDYRLSEGEQKEIVISLLQLFESGRFTETGVFWVIGKALSNVIIEHLAPFLETHWKSLNESLLHQALVALANGLCFDEKNAQEIAALLRQGDLQSCLREILQQDFAADSEVIYMAEVALNGLEGLRKTSGF